MNTEEKIEIMQAWLDGRTIQVKDKNYDDWEDLRNEPLWNFEEWDFRIKPKQKVKKTIKYLCFEHSDGNLVYTQDGSKNSAYYLSHDKYTRILEFDMTREIEVEE